MIKRVLRLREIQLTICYLQTVLKMSQETQQIESKLPIKVIIVGDGAVGKTCLAETFVTKEFPTHCSRLTKPPQCEEYGIPTVLEKLAYLMTVDDEVKTSRYALCA